MGIKNKLLVGIMGISSLVGMKVNPISPVTPITDPSNEKNILVEQTPSPHNYVFTGYDHNGAFRGTLRHYSKQSDFTILSYKDYTKPYMALADKEIPPNSNIILAAHGGKNNFAWQPQEHENKSTQTLYYADLFENLPRKNIDKIFIESCHGGSAIDPYYMRQTPFGAVVLSTVSEAEYGYGGLTDIKSETMKLHPIDSYIEILENIDPYRYSEAQRRHREDYTEEQICDIAIPPQIGIGGKPFVIIDFGEELEKISGNGDVEQDPKWREAIALVKERFNKPNPTAPTDYFIQEVANKIQCGETLNRYDESRIGYALSAAYLKTTGKFDHIREQTRNLEPQIAASENFINESLERANNLAGEDFTWERGDIVPRGVLDNVILHSTMSTPEDLDTNSDGILSPEELNELSMGVNGSMEKVFFETPDALKAARSFDCYSGQLDEIADELMKAQSFDDLSEYKVTQKMPTIQSVRRDLERASGKTLEQMDTNADCTLSYDELKPSLTKMEADKSAQYGAAIKQNSHLNR